MSAQTRMQWIDTEGDLAVARSSFYAHGQEREHLAGNLEAMRLINEEYTRALLRQPPHGAPRASKHHREPQTRTASDADDRTGGHGTGTEHEPAAPRAPDVPVPAARRERQPPQPSMEHRHHLPAHGTRLYVLDDHHRLVLQTHIHLAYQQ